MIQIAEVEPIAVELPLAKPVDMSGEAVSAAYNLVMRITDTERRTGWGEAASAPLMTGDTLPGMVSVAGVVAPRFVGLRVASVDDASDFVARTVSDSPGVRVAMEMALLDLLGKSKGLPLYQLIGGRVRCGAPVVRLLATGSQASEIEEARISLEQGIEAFKVKVGLGDIQRDLARCRAVRMAVGDRPRVSADANGGYCEAEALAFARAAGDAGLDFLEQPVPANNLDAMRACGRASTIPIAADEGMQSMTDIRRHHELQAASGGSLKPLKLGIRNLMACGQLMNNLGMHVNLAGKVAETGIGSAAVAHLAVSLPQLDWDASITNQYLKFDIVEKPISPQAGILVPSEAPGLGVHVDTGRLASVRMHGL